MSHLDLFLTEKYSVNKCRVRVRSRGQTIFFKFLETCFFCELAFRTVFKRKLFFEKFSTGRHAVMPPEWLTCSNIFGRRKGVHVWLSSRCSVWEYGCYALCLLKIFFSPKSFVRPKFCQLKFKTCQINIKLMLWFKIIFFLSSVWGNKTQKKNFYGAKLLSAEILFDKAIQHSNIICDYFSTLRMK